MLEQIDLTKTMEKEAYREEIAQMAVSYTHLTLPTNREV